MHHWRRKIDAKCTTVYFTQQGISMHNAVSPRMMLPAADNDGDDVNDDVRDDDDGDDNERCRDLRLPDRSVRYCHDMRYYQRHNNGTV